MCTLISNICSVKLPLLSTSQKLILKNANKVINNFPYEYPFFILSNVLLLHLKLFFSSFCFTFNLLRQYCIFYLNIIYKYIYQLSFIALSFGSARILTSLITPTYDKNKHLTLCIQATSRVS